MEFHSVGLPGQAKERSRGGPSETAVQGSSGGRGHLGWAGLLKVAVPVAGCIRVERKHTCAPNRKMGLPAGEPSERTRRTGAFQFLAFLGPGWRPAAR
jgi:hypothetical protein